MGDARGNITARIGGRKWARHTATRGPTVTDELSHSSERPKARRRTFTHPKRPPREGIRDPFPGTRQTLCAVRTRKPTIPIEVPIVRDEQDIEPNAEAAAQASGQSIGAPIRHRAAWIAPQSSAISRVSGRD